MFDVETFHPYKSIPCAIFDFLRFNPWDKLIVYVNNSLGTHMYVYL